MSFPDPFGDFYLKNESQGLKIEFPKKSYPQVSNKKCRKNGLIHDFIHVIHRFRAKIKANLWKLSKQMFCE